MVETIQAEEVGLGIILSINLLMETPKDEFSGKKYIRLQIVRQVVRVLLREFALL